MRVLLLSRYDEAGASSRYRTLQYLKYLKTNDIQVVVNPLLDSEYLKKLYSNKKSSALYYLKRYFKRLYILLFSKDKFDLLWIEGELFPYLPYFIERFFISKRYIAEYDDAIFHNYDSHRSRIVKWLLQNKIQNIMRRSLHVIVGNEYVKQYAVKSGAKFVTILPTVVDADVYRPVTVLPKKDDKVVVGWLGSPTTVKYLRLIEPVLIEIAKNENVRVLVIGGEYHINGIDISSHHWPNKWSEEEEITLLNQIDIGIMPLSNFPWDQGKCGFKLIKYMSCAKPMIASPVSANCDLIEHGINGYLAETLQEWKEYLTMLIQDPAKCQQFGVAGRELMVEKYSLQSTVEIFSKILNDSLIHQS